MKLQHPDISIIGVPKSGTSSLHGWLSELDGVCGSNPKETFYFMDSGNPLVHPRYSFENDRGRDYHRFFPRFRPGDMALDSTTHYFFQQTALQQFSKSGTKVCVVLREPTARLISYFQYVCETRDAVKRPVDFGEFARGLLDGNVEKFRNCFRQDREFFTLETSLRQGYYADYLEKWQKQMPSSALLVVLFEDLIADQPRFLKRIADFFGIPIGSQELQLSRDNETYKPKFPRLNRIARIASRFVLNESAKQAIRRSYIKFQKGEIPDIYSEYPEEVDLVREHYIDHIERLEHVSNLDVSCWRTLNPQKP